MPFKLSTPIPRVKREPINIAADEVRFIELHVSVPLRVNGPLQPFAKTAYWLGSRDAESKFDPASQEGDEISGPEDIRAFLNAPLPGVRTVRDALELLSLAVATYNDTASEKTGTVTDEDGTPAAEQPDFPRRPPPPPPLELPETPTGPPSRR